MKIIYLLVHAISYIFRNYYIEFPELNIFGLHPLLTELLIINGLLGVYAYFLTGFHYHGGFAVLGSVIYFIEYIVIVFFISACTPIFRLVGILDIVSLLITLIISLVINIKLATITK